MVEELSSDDRLMATVAHASVIVFGTGILASVLIWLTQKEKSPYASWQAMQATVYQIIGMIITMGLWLLWGILYALTFIPIVKYPEQYSDAPPPIFWFGLALMFVPLGVMSLWILYGLWGAWKTMHGDDFRYWVIGSFLVRFQKDQNKNCCSAKFISHCAVAHRVRIADSHIEMRMNKDEYVMLVCFKRASATETCA